MSDKETPEDEHFEPSFNDDFDFGEEEPLQRPAQKTTSPMLIKRLIWGVVIVVFSVIVSLGYKIFGSRPSHPVTTTVVSIPTPPPPAHLEVSHIEMPPHSTEAANAFSMPEQPTSASPHNIHASHPTTPVPPTPTTVPVPATAPTHAVNPMPEPSTAQTPAIPATVSTPVTPDSTHAPVTNALAAAPLPTSASTAPAPTTTTTTISTTGTIQELQRELFSPENPTTSEPAKTTVIVQNDLPTQHQVAELTTGLNKLNHQIDYILNQIKYLDSYSREVSDNLNKLNDSINTMDHRISALSNTTSTLSQDMGNVRSEVGHVKQVLREDGLDMNLGAIATPQQQQRKQRIPTEGAITVETPEYIVHAVIPGRAWLKSSKGQIITVTEGETLGNYGKILVIDATNGVVLTSSGIAFR